MRSQVQTEASLAEAVAMLIESIHRSFPHAETRPISPYEDEDFALEVRIPDTMDQDQVMNACIQESSEIAEEYGYYILTMVKRKG